LVFNIWVELIILLSYGSLSTPPSSFCSRSITSSSVFGERKKDSDPLSFFLQCRGEVRIDMDEICEEDCFKSEWLL
jgi:hypothetical protein